MTMLEQSSTHSAIEAVPVRVLLDRVQQLGPLLRRHAADAETRCRLADEVVEGLRGAGLFRLGAPKGHGGYEVDLTTAVAVIGEVGRFCASSAWIVAVTYSLQQALGSLPSHVHRDIWNAGSDVVMCGAFRADSAQSVAADGGLLVSGRWSWASGCHHAAWAWLAIPSAPTADGSATEAVMALLPVGALTVERTWNMVGMRATGSDTLVAQSVYVPRHRIQGMAQVFSGHAESGAAPLYRVGLGSMALALAAPMLGAARAVFDDVIATIRSGKPMAMSVYRSLADAPTAQAAVADAANLIDSSQLHLNRSAESMSVCAASGVAIPYAERARLRMDIAHASESLRRAVSVLLSTGGASSFSLSAAAQRHWRDLETAARHPMLNPDLFRLVYGRALLGNEEPLATLV